MSYAKAMGKVGSYLLRHLHDLSAPYLFVGSGISRRYAALDNWQGLLTRFSKFAGHSFQYYRGKAGSDYPKIATFLSKDFYDLWWHDPAFKDSVATWANSVVNESSPLKIEISKYTRTAIDNLIIPKELKDEYAIFKKINIDGIITTNYDQLLENTFPEFRPYIGQDELLFSDIQGIAEIYHIHGSDKQPNSLVLTKNDYQDYISRNAYLAAKLVTLFVEHPVIFLGYSLTDKNVQTLLNSLIIGLRPENIDKLQDHLIFVEWKPNKESSISPTFMNIQGASLPILRVSVPDFKDVFSALTTRERAIPARVLRVLKEQVFELVKSDDPQKRLAVVSPIENDNEAAHFDVVFGVGAKMTAVGIVGLSRWDIVDDVLASPERNLAANLMIEKALPKLAAPTYVPVFKYLSEEGLWSHGQWAVNASTINDRVKARAEKYARLFVGLAPNGDNRTMETLESTLGVEVILNEALELPSMTNDAQGLREFLNRHKTMRTSGWSTQFAKAVVAYDWMSYGA